MRVRAERRDGDEVTRLELFFDLVFVVALTQCTTVIDDGQGWADVGQSMILLGLLWWAWVGFTWVASAVDPDAGVVRLVMFVAMAAFLVAAMAVPGAFGGEALRLVVAYGALRVTHLGLAWLASREDHDQRRSLPALAASTVTGVGLLLAGALVSGTARELLWLSALLLDAGGSFLFGAAGWRLSPHHFAERHGLIIIVALGESVVAIGVGAGTRLSNEEVTGAVLGVFLAAALWWVYFDATSLVAARRLADMPAGKGRNELARDAYSYLHLPMVASVVLVAFAMQRTLAHIDEPLDVVPAVALGGGLAMYLLSHVAFKRRAVGIWRMRRVLAATALTALIPIWHMVVPLAAIAGVLAVMVALIVSESLESPEAAPAGTMTSTD